MANFQSAAPLEFVPISPVAGIAVRGWQRSKAQLPISREFTA